MNRFSRLGHRRELGITLVEVGIALAVMVIFAASVTWAVHQSNLARQAEVLVKDVMYMKSIIDQRYADLPSYSGLDNTILIDSGLLPSRMISSPTEMKNIFNGAIETDSVDINGRSDVGVRIRFAGIPADACIQAGRLDLGDHLYRISFEADGGTIAYETDDLPLSIPQLTSACGESTAAIVWIFG